MYREKVGIVKTRFASYKRESSRYVPVLCTSIQSVVKAADKKYNAAKISASFDIANSRGGSIQGDFSSHAQFGRKNLEFLYVRAVYKVAAYFLKNVQFVQSIFLAILCDEHEYEQ